MKIESIYDSSFVHYGKILPGYDTKELLKALDEYTPLPQTTTYVASESRLEALSIARLLSQNAYGGMPIQLGFCNGHNTKLNCLEYHRDSEINCGTTDFILLLAREDEIVDGVLDTDCVRAFLVPRGVMVEVYATTLHYAPCSSKKGEGFRVLVVLPRGTNEKKPDMSPLNDEDKLLWAKNKWLLAHVESAEASQGAAIVLKGKNIDIEADI